MARIRLATAMAIAAGVQLPLVLCGSATAQGRLEYLEQVREVQAETSHRPDAPELAERVVASDFGPFHGVAESYLFDPEDLDNARSVVSQGSRLDPLAITSSGTLSVQANGEFGRGHSRFDARFEVVGAPTNYTFRYDLTSEFETSPEGDAPFRAFVELRGPGGSVVGPTEIELFPENPDRGPGEAHFVRSGVLQPGEYRLQFNVEALSVSYTDDYLANYNFELAVPEPSSACAIAMMTVAVLLHRRRRG